MVTEPSPGHSPFTLRPLRGLRFDPHVVGDLGTVISPPYDVLDAETVRDLEAANRHNIVRLILSRRFERPYQAVRDRLRKWRTKSFLRADDEPGLYLYEYTVDGTAVRGLIGLVGLHDESEGVILPHEDVMAGVRRRPHRADAHHGDEPRADPARARGQRAAARHDHGGRGGPAGGRLPRARRQHGTASGR